MTFKYRSLNIEALGILALEEKVATPDEAPPPSKRRKTATLDIGKSDAFAMIDLYKSHGCLPSVRGLFMQVWSLSSFEVSGQLLT